MCKEKPIFIYAGSVKSGGGLSVVSVLLYRLCNLGYVNLVVYVGNKHIASRLRSEYPGLEVRVFIALLPSFVRTLISKPYFFIKSVFWQRSSVFITINFWMPVWNRLMVYHVNMLNFMPGNGAKISDQLRIMDAKLACYRADLNLFESNHLLDIAENATKKPISNSYVHYLGYSKSFDIPRVTDFDEGLILLVSSTQPHKNNEICLEALSRLREEHADINWRLHVFGGQSVEDWTDFVTLAKSYGLYEHIEIKGPRLQAEIATAMSRSSVLVTCSEIESFCMVAIEAMAAGCPVIAPEVSSMPESLGNAGVLVSPRKSGVLANAINRLCRDLGYREERIMAGYSRITSFSEEELSADFDSALKVVGFKG